MEGSANEKQMDEEEKQELPPTTTLNETTTPLQDDTKPPLQPKPKTSELKTKQKHKHKHKTKHSVKPKKKSTSTDTSTSDTDEADLDISTSSSYSGSSEDEKERKKRLKKRRIVKQKRKTRQRKSKRVETTTSDSEDSDSNSDSSADEKRRRKHKSVHSKKKRRESPEYKDLIETEANTDDEAASPTVAQLQAQIAALQLQNQTAARRRLNYTSASAPTYDSLTGLDQLFGTKVAQKAKAKKKVTKRGSALEYKRVDQLWDSTIHNYKITESAEDKTDVFSQYVFTVRRKFDWENKYKNTVVDIKSKILREALQTVMKDVKGVSLVEDQPSVDPNMLFMYLEELRAYAKVELRVKAKAEKKRKNKKKFKLMIAHCKVLVKYLDEDYAETKKTLHPMLEAGHITFDLLWALFKPNSIAYTPTYGSADDPRCFKVDYATKEASFMRGEWYSIEGRYLEYDGKSFGLGDLEVSIEAFKGPRKITGLSTYPLQYHKDPEGVKAQLIERGKRFIALESMNYRFHKGLAFMKKKKQVARININGRIMIDPALFRRINPNYPISLIKSKESEEDPYGIDNNSDEECSDCCCSENSDDDGTAAGPPTLLEEKEDRTKYKVVFDKNDKPHVIQVPIDADGQELHVETIDKLAEDVEPSEKRQFTEEELLIASPVVLGFAFSEKLWLEFSLSGVNEISWNEGAFDSLVLPNNQKTIVRALVESHKFHAAKTIDDVVQGKGKGLVAVLHGAPGTGKTLTAEGIAELLRCPLYMVSAGELGTDPRVLEYELQKILDIAHSWGAVLLLDEADVFLEKRQVHDIHRNALVSIFLRLLEYFQGILFLTTNRVETFDDAFQSRIHVALRYGELTVKAKKAVWKMFLEKVRRMEVDGGEVGEAAFGDVDFEMLARYNLNGRQIKNLTKTAQALAVNEKRTLNMEHIKRVLEVAETFDQDLKGGMGYKDAMRSYT